MTSTHYVAPDTLHADAERAREQHGSSADELRFATFAAILDTLAASPDELNSSQIAARTGHDQEAVTRLLAILARHDYVTDGAEPGTFRLGLELFRLGTTVQHRLELRQRSLAIMHNLAEATEETVSLFIRRGDEALCIARVEGKHVQVLSMEVGSTLPLYTGAASRVLLAALPDDRVDDLLSGKLRQLTRFSEINPARLREIVAEIRRQGYAISDEDVTLGVAAISAPVYGPEAEIVGAITISGITQRLTRDRMPILVAQVMNAADRISRAMGDPNGGNR
jgi:DNA-binding IclR family transcriptional regulator